MSESTDPTQVNTTNSDSDAAMNAGDIEEAHNNDSNSKPPHEEALYDADPQNDSTSEAFEYSHLLDELNDYFTAGNTRPLDWRKKQLKGLTKLLKDNQKAVKTALFNDLGKCQHEAYVTEVGYMQSEIKHTLKALKKWMKPVKKGSPMLAQPASSYVVFEPLGTVLIIGAWNYPLQLTLSPMVAALAAGNCAVLKPSEMAAHTSALLAELLPKYVDTKAIKVVEGAKDETTALLALPFNKMFYTGGEQVGKVVMRAASEHLTPVTLELGGKSPCVVDDNLDFDVVANRIAWGKWMNAGQTCVAPDYVLISQASVDAFIAALKKAIDNQYSKEPKQSKEYGRIVNQRHCQRLASYLVNQEVIYGGQIDLQSNYISPTVVLNPAVDSLIMQEEIFGPILPILIMPSKQDMIAFINSRAKPLAAYLFTDDKGFESEFVNSVSAGSMCINDTMMFMLNPNLPFGGIGRSGMGRYHGKYGFDTFSHEKSVMRRSFMFENTLRYAPFTWFKKFMIKRFVG